MQESQTLPPAPSTASATAETGHRLSELNLDDLLGLNDATPSAAADSKPATPQADPDPFAVPLQVCHALHRVSIQSRGDSECLYVTHLPGIAASHISDEMGTDVAALSSAGTDVWADKCAGMAMHET